MNHNRKNNGFSAVASKPTSNCFSINYANIRGVSSNINAVQQHLQMERPHILALTETQVSPDTKPTFLDSAVKEVCVSLLGSTFPVNGWRLWNLGTSMLCGSKSLPGKLQNFCAVCIAVPMTNHTLLSSNIFPITSTGYNQLDQRQR